MDESIFDDLPERLLLVEQFRLEEGTRRAQRRQLAERWLSEREHTRYRYNVEACADGTVIYIMRPARLNNGFDFEVHIEDWSSPFRTGRRSSMPSHNNVLDDLRAKRIEDLKSFDDLMVAIRKVYLCVEPKDALGPNPPAFSIGLSSEALLCVIKWLFIEQDLTYWNWTGRRKLWKEITSLLAAGDVPIRG